MKRKLVVLILVLFVYVGLSAQTITGNLSQMAKQEIRLEGFNVFGTPTMYLLDASGKILVKPVSADHANAWMQAKEKLPERD